MTNNIEKVTIDHSVNLNEFLLCLDLADKAETVRFNETERAINLLKLMRNQYSTLQDGRSIGKPPQAGEMPAAMYHEVIQGIYNYKKQAAEEQKQDFTLKYDSYRDFQVKQLKYYIETGDLLNNKKSTLQERALVAIDKLEKKLKAEQAKAEKLRVEKEKADAEKAKADAEKAKADADAEKAKADAEQTIDEIFDIFDENPQGADSIKDELYDVIEDAEASIAEAELVKIDATKAAELAKTEAELAKAEADKAEAEANTTQSKLTKAKDRLAKLSRGKADSNETNPDLSEVNFSKDCEAKMQSLLDTMESEFSEAEMLCLSRLIRKRYTPSKV